MMPATVRFARTVRCSTSTVLHSLTRHSCHARHAGRMPGTLAHGLPSHTDSLRHISRRRRRCDSDGIAALRNRRAPESRHHVADEIGLEYETGKHRTNRQCRARLHNTSQHPICPDRHRN